MDAKSLILNKDKKAGQKVDANRFLRTAFFILVVELALSPVFIGDIWLRETISSANATISTLKVTTLNANTTITPSNTTKNKRPK